MNVHKLIKELKFKAIRSAGAGGQHVNKVSSKIELSFDLVNSKELSANEKEILLKKLSNRLTKGNVLLLFCDKSRSQHSNKALVIKRFLEIIAQGLKVSKLRKATKPTKNSIRKKAINKKHQALKKTLRKKPSLD